MAPPNVYEFAQMGAGNGGLKFGGKGQTTLRDAKGAFLDAVTSFRRSTCGVASTIGVSSTVKVGVM
jgi:hypothetical protein